MTNVDIHNHDALSTRHEFFDILDGIVVFKGGSGTRSGDKQRAPLIHFFFFFSLCCSFLIIVEIITQASVIEKLLPSATSLTTSKYPTVRLHTRGLAHGLWRGCCSAGLLKNRVLSGSSDKATALCLQAVIPVAPSVQDRVRTTKDKTASSLDGRTSLAPSWTGWTDGRRLRTRKIGQ